MKEAIEMIVKALVDDSSAVEVSEIDKDGSTIISVRVAQPDIGKLIGKQGRTVRALRSLVNAAAAKKHKRYFLEIVE